VRNNRLKRGFEVWRPYGRPCQQDAKAPEQIICVKVAGKLKRLVEEKLY